MKNKMNFGLRMFLFVLIALALFSYFPTFAQGFSTATPIYFNVNVPTVITNISTNLYLTNNTNNGTNQSVEVNFSTNDYPINITFKIYNESGALEYSEGIYQINSINDLPINFTIYDNLSDGNYSVNMSVINIQGIQSNYLVDNFTVDTFVTDTTPPVITNVSTLPLLPLINNGTEENVIVNFTSNEYPINITFNIYNQTGDLEYSEGVYQINSSNDLPINFTIPSGLVDGNYTINMTATDSSNNSNTINIGNFSVQNISLGNELKVFLEHPLIGHYPYPINKSVSLIANITSENDLNLTIAEVTLPDATKINVSLAKFITYDDFSINTLNYYWFVKNQTIGESQQCVVDISKGKATTSILGDGSPRTDTYCGMRTSSPYYGDFDTNVSFKITHESGDSYALLAKISEEPEPHKPGKHIFISLGKWGSYGRTYDVFANDGNISEYLLEDSLITDDTEGKIRLKRVGDIFTFFVWNNTNNSWIELIETELQDMPCAMYFTLEVENAAPDWGRIDVEWDDASIFVKDFYAGLFSNTSLEGQYNVTFIAKDNLGLINNTEKTYFNITHVNIIPSVPFLLKPQPDEILSGMYNILWSDVYDPNNDNVRFNISLLNTDYSFNRTIVSNYGNINTNNYWGNTSKVSDGEYSLEILVFENETEEKYSSYDYIWGNFTIDNTKPTIEFVSPTPISGSAINNNKIIMNVSVYDENFDGIYYEIYNETWDLVYDDYLYDNYFESINLTDGFYYFMASAYDLAGNYEYTEERNVTIYQNNFIFTNHSLNPQLDLAYFGDYNYRVNVESYNNISKINLTYKTINAEDISCFEFYVNGSCINDKSTTVNMSLLQEPTWYYMPIYADDIYPQIAFAQDEIFWNNEPISENITDLNYHILKFKNNFTINKDSNIWIEFDATAKNIPKNKLRVYLFDNTTNISIFNSSWLDSEKGELVATINPSDEKHHTHSENSSHYVIPLTAHTDGTVGSKNLEINNEFWVVLFSNSDTEEDLWEINYRNESLCNTTNWWTGSTNNWTTNQKITGCPDAHIHVARYNIDKKSDCVDTYVCGLDILNNSHCSDNQTFCFENILNLPPRANQIISPEKYQSYSCLINISWLEFVDPNGDDVTYNINLLDSNYEFVRTIASNLQETNYLWHCYGDVEGTYIPDNKYTLSVEGVDDENASSKTYTDSYFIIDNNAPQINIISPINTYYDNYNILLNISVIDASLDKIWYNFNGTNITYNGEINITGIEGINTIHVWANDSLGNLAYKTVTFIIDTINPTLEIISPINTTYIYNPIMLNISATDSNLQEIIYNFNGTNATYTTSTNITFNEGWNTLNVTAKDLAGNINFTSLEFFVDSKGPECYLVNRTPTKINDSSRGLFEVIIRCTDTSGINMSKIDKSYQRAFVTYTVDNLIISEGVPNHFSLFYPENSLTSYGHPALPDYKFKVWRGSGRNINLVQWYEHLNYTDSINADVYSYTINDGRLFGNLNITNITGNETHPTEVEIKYSANIETNVFRTAFYLCQLSQTGEVKKEYTLTNNNIALTKMFDAESYRNESNYTMFHYFNINSSEIGASETINIFYCNNSYNISNSTNLQLSPNCAYLDSLSRNDINDKDILERNSQYIQIEQEITNGNFAGVKTSSEYYIGVQVSGEITNESERFKFRYVNGTNPSNITFNETKTAWISSDAGNSWIQAPWTFDYFKTSVRHQDNEEYSFGLYVEDIYGKAYANFQLFMDAITPTYLAPITNPTILIYNSSLSENDYNLNKIHSNIMNIKIGMSYKRHQPGDVIHNLTLIDVDENYIYIINGSFNSIDDSDVWINFNTSKVLDGTYRMKIVAQSTIDPLDIQTYVTSSSFRINNFDFDITNVSTIPLLPLVNNGTEENISVNFTSNEYPINITFNIYNQTGDLEYSEGVYQINSSNDLPINFTIYDNLSDGNYLVNMTLTNVYNESNTTTLGNFIVDKTLPTIQIISPENKIYNNATIFLNISAYDANLDYIFYNWNGTDVTYTTPKLVTFGEGTITLFAYANDTASNINSTNVTFSVDSVPPIITSIKYEPPVLHINQSTLIKVNVSDNVQLDDVYVNITYPNATIEKFNLMNIGGTHQYNFTPKNIGNYSILVYANDTANNYITELGNQILVGPVINWNGTIINATNNGLNSSIEIIYGDDIVVYDSQEGLYIQNISIFLYDLLIKAYSDSVQVLLKEVNLSNNNNQIFGLDKFTDELGYKVIYGMNNSNFTFVKSEVTLSYYGINYSNEDKLYIDVCENWIFGTRTCNSSWIKVDSVIDKNLKVFKFNRTKFSAFAINEDTLVSPLPPTGGNTGGFNQPCDYDWACTAWSECSIDGETFRECVNIGTCSDLFNPPILIDACEYEDDVGKEIQDGIIVVDVDNTTGMTEIVDEKDLFEKRDSVEIVIVKSCFIIYGKCLSWWILMILTAILTFFLLVQYLHSEERK